MTDDQRFLLSSLLFILALFLLGAGIYFGYGLYTSYKYPYRTVNEPLPLKAEPDQQPLPFEVEPIRVSRGETRYWILPQYQYEISGEVLVTDRYWHGPMAEISPLDVSLGWGYLIHPKVQKYLSYDHGDRFYTWRISADAPRNVKRGRAYIISHSSNNHIIPANERIRFGLSRLEQGDEVKLTGYLVNVHKFNEKGERIAKPWTTSVHRRDFGAKGCEILYVRRARINDRVYDSSFRLEDHRR